ncbi:protease [Pollutimonas nitritireducens]|uniref:Protease n=1 Tax=Pollutimonas nitritireducens TaxID=2045209 RepID=A0A2N4UJZ3_9BURK|nr:S8 family serine peptidase [Pollutimonas nitritireducens]PLC55343.1 protease [Pollutimonas nitritireducens]
MDPIPSRRYLVLLCQDRKQEAFRALKELTGGQVTSIATLAPDGELPRAQLTDQCAVVFDRIGVALLRCGEEKRRLLAMAAQESNPAILAIELERQVRAMARPKDIGIPVTPSNDPESLAAYLKGYRDAVNEIVDRALERQGPAAIVHPPSTPPDEASMSWGVHVTRSAVSTYNGRGVKLAVLDTGLDLTHPDFAARQIVSRSFVDGESVQDGNGHGTHCAGIAGGPARPSAGPRYGVAGEVELYIGKVLGDQGGGADGSVLEGINWAIEHGCHIISMSLGSSLESGQNYSKVFEEVARRALAAGTVIIAAAGNESRRPELIAPVSHPANCPSIFAVGAVDQALQTASFSCAGLVPDGGQVDIAGPGVQVLSSWPVPQRHNTLSGTSMATPFVAGIAALHAQSDPALRSRALLNILVQTARRLTQPSRDVGAGLVQAP